MATKTPEELITPELIADIRSGVVKVDALDANEYGAAMPLLRERLLEKPAEPAAAEKFLSKAGAEFATQAEADAADAAAAEAVRAAAPASRESDVDEHAEEAKRLEASKSAAAEHARKLKEFNDIIAQPEPEDDLSEGWRTWRKNREAAIDGKTNLVNDRLEALQNESISSQETRVSSSAERSYHRQAEDIQKTFPVLKTETAFPVAEKAATNYFSEILKAHNGGTMPETVTGEMYDAAWNRYLSDAAFKASLPAAPKDFENTTIIMEAKNTVARIGGTLLGAVATIMSERGLMTKFAESEYQRGVRETADLSTDALRRRAGEPVPSPLSGAPTPKQNFDGPVTMESTREHCGYILAQANERMSKNLPTSREQQAQLDIARERISKLNAETRTRR